MPLLVGATFGARTPIAEFMTRLKKTSLKARIPSPNSDHGRGECRWKRAILPSEKNNPWLEEFAIETLVPAAGTTP